MSELRGLYPPIEPYATGMLDVGDGHSIYYERSGKPGGTPAVFLHGGPGGKITPLHRRMFDPDRYDALLFEQRGTGRSTPQAGLEANTTWHLVADIERLRAMAGVDRWLVLGESWGTTLGLAYAQRFPARVSALVLQGIYFGTKAELRWAHQFGISELFPEKWDCFQAPIPAAERGDMIAAYRSRIMGADRAVQLQAAKAWSAWEGETMTLLPDAKLAAAFTDDQFALTFALLENHYIAHDYWLEDGQPLRDAHLLHGMAGAIIHGRYDMPCPAHYADALHKAWPEASFHLVEAAGHAFSEPPIMTS